MSEQRYFVEEPILSVQMAHEGNRSCVYVPAGEVISVQGATSVNTEMVEVSWDARTVLMFQRDITERAHPVLA